MGVKGLVTNYGERGATQREGGGGGTGGFTPTKRGGAEKVLGMLKGGTTTFGVVYAVA